MVETTFLFPANTTKSLRTTVPRSIVKQFDLSEDSSLEWDIKVEGKNMIIHVRPIKTSDIKRKKGKRRRS